MNRTDPLLRRLHDGYTARCHNGRQQKSDWREIVSRYFPPILKSDDVRRPNLLLAEEAGDMGLALLWIVQAALVQPCLQLIKEKVHSDHLPSDRVTVPDYQQLGALAHSEDKNHPLIAHTTAGDNRFLEGTKKYITGGDQADFIFITARRPEEPGVSEMYRLAAQDITPQEMTLLDLGGLYTISHGRLTLTKKPVPGSDCLPLSGSRMRRYLAVWGLVERGLILESFIAALIYLARRLSTATNGMTGSTFIDTESTLVRLMTAQRTAVTDMIKAAMAGRHVSWQTADIHALQATAEMVIQAGNGCRTMDKAFRSRFEDVKRIAALLWK